MSEACGCASREPGTGGATEVLPWWRDRSILIPLAAGAVLLGGLAWDRLAGGAVPVLLFWGALLLGASTFVPGALRALLARRIGIGTLMTLSAVGAVALGHVEEAAALAFLYSIAEALEDRALDRARGGLRALLSLVPETARVQRGAEFAEAPVSTIQVGQLLLVRPGDRIATDGLVREGRSSLDTSAITGESIPVAVEPGDAVSAGAINSSGVLHVEATASGSENSLTRIVELVEQAQAEQGARARFADRIARPLVPGVLVLAVLVAVIGSLYGDPELWVTRALVILVAASPCALAISVPLTVVAAIGAASRFGVVITSGAAFERLGRIRRIAIDKTGTLTRNAPSVVGVLTAPGIDPSRALAWAAALEQRSTHPLAAAIINAAPSDAVRSNAADVEEHAGQGISGTIDGTRIAVGSPRWLNPEGFAGRLSAWEGEGITAILVHRDAVPVAAIGIRDELRPEAAEAMTELAALDLPVTMLTGDNARTAHALAAQAGIVDVRAELRPEDKAAAVRVLDDGGSVAMVGDGINDAPALAAADVGIAMGANGSDAAIESADIAFTGHDLRLLPRALAHARRGGGIILQNVVLSLVLIAVLLPLAGFGVLGLTEVVLIHELAEVLVILNGLRAARIRGSREYLLPPSSSLPPSSRVSVRR